MMEVSTQSHTEGGREGGKERWTSLPPLLPVIAHDDGPLCFPCRDGSSCGVLKGPRELPSEASAGSTGLDG